MTMVQVRTAILADCDFDTATFKVLLKLISILDENNLVTVNPTSSAIEMKIEEGVFVRAIKNLLDEVIILKTIEFDEENPIYRMNSHYAWRGTAENHYKAMESDPIPFNSRIKKSGIKALINGGKD
jgi:hypothetical protein